MSENRIHSLKIGDRVPIPFFQDSVKAGFPSPAQDFVEASLDLTELCIKNPAATFFVRADGDSMVGAGIHDSDVLVVDRSLNPTHGRIVIATVDGEFVCKRLDLSDRESPALRAENPRYADIRLRPGEELEVFGVVTFVVHSLGKP